MPDLTGYLCEQCLDAPAVALVPAPWGGEMGVCEACGGLPVRPTSACSTTKPPSGPVT